MVRAGERLSPCGTGAEDGGRVRLGVRQKGSGQRAGAGGGHLRPEGRSGRSKQKPKGRSQRTVQAECKKGGLTQGCTGGRKGNKIEGQGTVSDSRGNKQRRDVQEKATQKRRNLRRKWRRRKKSERWRKSGLGQEKVSKEKEKPGAEMSGKSEGGKEQKSGPGEVSLQGGEQPAKAPAPAPPPAPGAARDTYKATKQFFHSRPELLPFS